MNTGLDMHNTVSEYILFFIKVSSIDLKHIRFEPAVCSNIWENNISLLNTCLI